MNVVIGSDGIMIGSNQSSIILAYSQLENQFIIKHGDSSKTIDLKFFGNLLNKNGECLEDIVKIKFQEINEKMFFLEKEKNDMQDMLDSVYFAPGMPGYLEAKAHFSLQQDNLEINDEIITEYKEETMQDNYKVILIDENNNVVKRF